MTQIDFTGRTLGGYRILRKLGQGGMAVVYKAHEESLNRVVALKVIAQHLAEDEQFIARFQREAQAAAQLNHPNIVQIYAIGEDQGVHYFSMEFVKGRSLAEIIEEEGFMPAGRALPIIAQAAEALAAAHEAGIVHRDIKPANIMVDGNGRVKVADFGIAQMATATRMTQSGILVGTPEFISPEQCRGEKLDGRSDIYSLGVTLYQLLVGRTPFEADTPAALVFQIIEGPIPQVGELNPTVSQDVRDIVAKMMHTDRNQRYQSAEDLAHALRAADTQPVTSGARPHPAPGVVGAVEAPADRNAATTPHGDAGPTEAMPPTAAPAATDAAPAPAAVTDAAPAPDAVPATDAAPAPRPAPTDADNLSTEPHPEPQSPATAAYAGRSGNNRGALLGLAAAVLIIITVLVVGWQFMGHSDAEGFDPTSDARPQAIPELQTKDAGNATTEPTAAGAGDDATAAAGATGGAAAETTAAEAPAETATADAGAGGGATADAGTPPETAATEPAQASTPPASARATTGQGAGPPQAAVVEEQPAFTPPPDDSIVAETSGEYEYVEQVHAWIESEFGDQRFVVIDLPSSPAASLAEAARYQVATSARLVGTEPLQYFGNVQTQYTVSLTSRVIDLASGRTVVGPETETIKYTSVNMQQNLEQGTTNLARRMARELRQLIRMP
ncbi:MAG: serine/threonine-protein kinase [Acidobacteriota bacterium]|jgi:tRNA A-37 threonylcarbamoyl transferase component Bud32